MMEGLALKVSNLPTKEWHRAHRCAIQFLIDYPKRRGVRNGCVYANAVYDPLYVYRTKTQIVVRGTGRAA